jgi:hypothetical protein
MPWLDSIYIPPGEVSPNVPEAEREPLKRKRAAQALENGCATDEDLRLLGVQRIEGTPPRRRSSGILG